MPTPLVAISAHEFANISTAGEQVQVQKGQSLAPDLIDNESCS
jgi:hypothetical protein